VSPMPQLGMNVRTTSLRTTNHALKVMAKRVLRNDDFVLFLKAAKVAVESRAGRASDWIFPLLPQIIETPDPVIIDVGANMGQFASRAARQFPGGQIYSFEPVRTNAIGLRRVLRWLRVANVEVLDEAICDMVGVEPIHIPSFDAYQDGTLAVLEHSKRVYDNVTYHVETVRTNTLDTFTAAREIKRIDFLKIDTEGAEDRVVSGGMAIITALLPTLYMEATPDQPCVEALCARGYLPFYTDGVRLHPPRPQERQNDVLLVHRSKVDRLAKLMRGEAAG
jgi:FkbM family methyltransferase